MSATPHGIARLKIGTVLHLIAIDQIGSVQAQHNQGEYVINVQGQLLTVTQETGDTSQTTHAELVQLLIAGRPRRP